MTLQEVEKEIIDAIFKDLHTVFIDFSEYKQCDRDTKALLLHFGYNLTMEISDTIVERFGEYKSSNTE